MIRFFFFFLIFFILNIKTLFPKDFPEIFGCFCEGGMILGKANKNDILMVDNKKVEIFDTGEFVFAFGRKFKDTVTISINVNKKSFSVKNKEYLIERIDGLRKNKVVPGKNEIQKIKDDQKKIRESKKIGSKKKFFGKEFSLPVEGRISGFFGSQRILNKKPRSPHNGIDIAASKGTPIVSPSSGIVKLIEHDMFFTGKTLIIDHGLGLISIFAHLNDIMVSQNQEIKKGETIGTIGMTGRATGPHLHWGVYLQNIPVDPMSLINSTFF